MEKISASKKIVLFLAVFSLLLVPFYFGFSEQAEDVQKALNYLKFQPADPWQTMALAAAGEKNLDLTHLKEVSGNLATDYEKVILALTANAKDPRTFGSSDLVLKLKGFFQSSQLGSPDLLNDDFWGVLALVSAGESLSDPVIEGSKNFILANQNSDGGWSYALGGASDTNDTAAALMALLEAGIKLDSPQIAKALDFLKANQNEDGGFPYSALGQSDSGSDTWLISLIYKLKQNPRDWTKNGKNPIDHLKSLQRPDGSFKWIESEDKGYSMFTAYAVIALTQNYYPVFRLHNLRIEGKDGNICNARVKAKTALDIVENGSKICAFTYLIEQTSFGPYLKRINQEEALAEIGWLYFVNYNLPSVGAADYILEPGEEVLWYFGEWGWKPAKLILDKNQVALGAKAKARVEYLESDLWKPLAGATIYADGLTFTANEAGEADLTINTQGAYQVYGQKAGFIRTEKKELLVGEGVSQNINLKVEIMPPLVPASPAVAFTINKSEINFGQLRPGARNSDKVVINNGGSFPISVESLVSGEQIFRENITLNELPWPDFSALINAGSNKDVNIGLTVPQNWASFGSKEGNLTFWAIAGQ